MANEESTTPKRKKSRSPNYPIVGLPAAIEGVKKVYAADHLNRMQKAVVAAHLGYTSLHGASMGQISALAKYGLLETVDDSYKVSQNGVTIVVDQADSQERQSAIRQAAFRPVLFAELNQYFGGQTPSEENLKAHLQKQGFIPNAALAAAQAFRETMELVSKEGGMYDPSKPKDGQEETKMDQLNTNPGGKLPPPPPPPVIPGEKEFAYCPLGQDRGARVLFKGQPTQADIDDLVAYLNIVKRRLPKEPETSTEE